MRMGLLWRDDRSAGEWSQKARERLGPLFAALGDAEAVLYDDDAVDDVRAQVLGLDAVLVWVNPIQDGADRGRLDALLREVVAAGVYVSAHPDVIARLGTKEVLYETRHLGWGTDTDRYVSAADFAARFPARLARDGVRVLKQARGNGGQGVWTVEYVRDGVVRVTHAKDGSSAETALDGFVEQCGAYFAWSGCLVDQPFATRVADGTIRCYVTRDEVVGFCHQQPRGHLMEPPDTPKYATLRGRAEGEWIPAMREVLGLPVADLPVIWDADFLYGEGDGEYVLCEINASAVWPFPPGAVPAIISAVRGSGAR